MSKHIGRGKEEEKKGKGKGKRKEDNDDEEEGVDISLYAGGRNVRRSECPQPTNGYYRIKEGVCGIWIDKNSEGGIDITTDPPTTYDPGDTGWAYIPVTEGTEIYGRAVFYLCYPG
jgi:hypothetical protein